MPSLLFPLLFGSILCYLFLRKKKETRNKTSVTFTVFTFLWINSVCLLFFFTFPELLKNGYAYITYPKYEAEIVDIKSQYEWTSTRGSRSRRRMHTPIIAFKPENSTKYLKMPLNISSQEKPSIGDHLKIAYKDNSIYEISTKGYLFLTGTAVLVIFLFYPILYLIFIIVGKDTTYLKRFGVRSFVYLALLAIVAFVIIIFMA